MKNCSVNRGMSTFCVYYQTATHFHLKTHLFNEFYFIERPQFILFFLSCFGSSPLFCHYLMDMSLNCQFSPYNARNCHDGCLDTVFLQFLAEGKEECTVVHRGITMELKIPDHYQKKCIFPFLISMFSAKTSYSVVALLHKLCRMKNIDFLSVFESAMAECALRHSPYYLISSLPVDSHSNDINITSNQFSFRFGSSSMLKESFEQDQKLPSFQLLTNRQHSLFLSNKTC